MSDPKPNDQKATIAAFNQLVRDEHSRHRVHWRPSTSLDPDVQRQDRADLNRALRRAGGRVEGDDEPDESATPFPWKSLQPRNGDT